MQDAEKVALGLLARRLKHSFNFIPLGEALFELLSGDYTSFDRTSLGIRNRVWGKP